MREKGSDAVRTNFAAHLISAPFARLARHPRMVRAGDGPAGRSAVHAPVQDQRQDGLRRRRLAVAPGLRHLAQRRPDAHRARDERGHLPGRRERVQRPADVHPRQPQEGRARRAARHAHHQLPAVDRGRRADPPAGRTRRRQAWRHRLAQGPGRLDDPVPQLPGARLGQQPVAVEPRQRVPEPVRGQQPHPPLQAARVHRAPRLHADRMPGRRLPAAQRPGRAAVEGRAAGQRAADLAGTRSRSAA